MPRRKDFDDQARAPKRAYVSYTEQDDATIRSMLEAGESLVAVGKALGRSPKSVYQRAKVQLGIQLEPRDPDGRIAKMTEAKRRGNARRLAELTDRLLTEANELLGELHAPQDRVERGRVEPGIDGPVAYTEPRPPARDRLAIMQAAVLAMREARAAHEQQQSQTHGADVDRWLAHITGVTEDDDQG